MLRAFKLERPAFGGSNRKPLKGSYRLATAAKVEVRVLRGRKIVKRFKAANRAAKKTYRFTLGLKGLAKGDYKVRLTITAGGKTLRSSLTSRRL